MKASFFEPEPSTEDLGARHGLDEVLVVAILSTGSLVPMFRKIQTNLRQEIVDIPRFKKWGHGAQFGDKSEGNFT